MNDFSRSISSFLAPSFVSFSASFSKQSIFIISLSSSHSMDPERFTVGLKNFARKVSSISKKRAWTFRWSNLVKLGSLLWNAPCWLRSAVTSSHAAFATPCFLRWALWLIMLDNRRRTWTSSHEKYVLAVILKYAWKALCLSTSMLVDISICRHYDVISRSDTLPRKFTRCGERF